MTAELSRRLARAVNSVLMEPGERGAIMDAALEAEVWEDLPLWVRARVVLIETAL